LAIWKINFFSGW